MHNDWQRFYKYMKGKGLEISRNPYVTAIPNTKIHFWNASCKDASRLTHLHEKFNFVFVDGELDKLNNFFLALANWGRVLLRGGHIICKVVNYNTEHKIARLSLYQDKTWTFSTNQETANLHLNVKKSVHCFKALNLNLVDLFETEQYLWFVLRKKNNIKIKGD